MNTVPNPNPTSRRLAKVGPDKDGVDRTPWVDIDKAELQRNAEARGGFGMEFRWISANLLTPAQEYNRIISWSWVRKIAREFDPTIFDPLEVSDRGGGHLVVMDGQHRLLAVREMGWGDKELPCLVKSDLTLQDEAALFAAQKNVRGLSPMDIHRAEVVKGDPIAVAIEQDLASVGFRIGLDRHPTSVGAVASCYSTIRIYGQTAFYETMLFASEAWRHAPGATFIKGMPYFLKMFGEHAHFEEARVIECLRTTNARGFEQEAIIFRTMFHQKDEIIGARIIHERYNKRLRTRKLPEWSGSL